MRRVSGRSIIDGALRVVRTATGAGPLPPFTIERIPAPSLEEFERKYRHPPRPVIFEGLTDHWPARRWTVESLRKSHGHRKIPVVPTQKGIVRNDARIGLKYEWMLFGDYLDRLESGGDPGCYMICPLGEVLPELKQDIDEPTFSRNRPYHHQSRFFFGSAGTVGPLHHDLLENFFVQLVGRKRFLLNPPQNSPWLYSNPIHSSLPNFSQFNPEEPDYQRFPLAKLVPPVEVVLQPGDVMYLPSRWWHETRSLDLSMSVNFWWADGALLPVVLLADWVKRMRSLEIYSINDKGPQSARLDTQQF